MTGGLPPRCVMTACSQRGGGEQVTSHARPATREKGAAISATSAPASKPPGGRSQNTAELTEGPRSQKTKALAFYTAAIWPAISSDQRAENEGPPTEAAPFNGRLGRFRAVMRLALGFLPRNAVVDAWLPRREGIVFVLQKFASVSRVNNFYFFVCVIVLAPPKYLT